MKKIVIAGPSTYGVKNQGDDAMFKVFCDGIRKKIPGVEITFLARHPNKEFDQIYGVKSIKNLDHNSKKESLGRWFNGFNPGDLTTHLRYIREEISSSDLVVIGGNSFMEVSPSEFLKGITTYSATIATWARLFEKPFVIYGAAVYPIESDYTKQIARFLCNNAALVTLRENDSKKELIRAGIINDSRIKVLSDPAFGLDPIKKTSVGKKILEKEKIRLKNEKLVGVVFRHMYWLWNDEDFLKYGRKMADLCDFIIEKFKSDILFIPNCTYNIDTKYTDDRFVANSILSKMKNKDRAHVINNEYHLNDLLSIYPLLDMLISNRRHALIFGAIHRVPIVALSTGHPWHFKPWIKELSLSSQLASLTDDTISEIETRIIESFNRSDKIKKTISKTVPRLREKALRGIDEISKIILK